MKQITKEIVITLLNEDKIKLQSTHDKLCLPIINRIYKKMKFGIKFSPIGVAEEDLIMDGHHRYIASRLAEFDLEVVPSITTSATIVTDWKLVEFVDQDWDTEEKIKMLNEQDAKYNNIHLDKLIELLK
jgi:hypothetical protein